MRQKNRRLIAILCVLCMLFTSMPVSVWADPVPATPTDLLPVDSEETTQDPEQAKPGTEGEELPEPEETEDPEETEEPEKTEEPETDKPAADQEVTGSDDITVTGSLEGNPPADYLIRFIPEKNQTLCLILTTDGEVKASVTDEHTNTTKQFVYDHTDEEKQNILTLPYYKVSQENSYLVRISGSSPAAFSVRFVRMSILKAEQEENADSETLTGEEAVPEPADPEPEQRQENPEEPAAETTEVLAAEQEETPEAEPATEPKDANAEAPAEMPAGEPAEAPAAEPEAEPKAQEAPATPTDLEPVREEPMQPEPVQAEPEQAEATPVRISAVCSGTEVWIEFMSDAGIPQDAELHVLELTEEEQAAYTARTVRAMKCGDESYLYYTKYLALALTSNGEAIEPKAPVSVSVTLPDVQEGAEALQAVSFGKRTAKLLDSEMSGRTITFRTASLDVIGIGNALTPLTTQETELASVEVLGFSADAEISLKEAEAPEVEEGLEVLGTFTIEDQSGTKVGQDEQDSLWIKAELNEDADLAPMESVSLYRVEDGQADVLMEDLADGGEITELDAQQVAVVKDTGYRHLTLTVSPDENNEEQAIILDGMMPKEAEAAATDVTEDYADHEYPVPETDTAGQPAETTGREETEPARTTLAAYDISISNGDEAYQPDEDKPISVEIFDSRITTDQNIELWHIRDDGTQEQVTEFTVEEGRITFEAIGFSVYTVVVHEDGTVRNPRVVFHFIADGANEGTDGTNVYYIGDPYIFKNKDGNEQSTQILADGESLELITDPGNQQTKFFYGWYVVNPFPVSGTTDEYGISTTDSTLYYTWPVAPESVSFNRTLSIGDTNVQIGDPVNWRLGNVSGRGNVDRDGNVHVFLAPVFEKYNFVNFMLYPWTSGTTNSSNVMTRKMIALGSSTSVDVKISDVRSTSSDPVHLIFIGWQYNAGTEQNPDWHEYQTVEYTGAEMTDPGKDGVYLNVDLTDTSSVDLYPIFIQARWVDYNPGASGNGAVYVPSVFRESWGPDPQNPPAGMTADPERNVFTHMVPSSRAGYVFGGWYAYAVTDSGTGEITNLETGADVQTTYITSANEGYQSHEQTLSDQKAIQITNGNGEIVYNGSFSVNGYTLFSGDGSTLKIYDSLDRLTLYARWIPAETKITIVYWTENTEDDNYTASAAKEVYTKDLSAGLGRPIASGSTITLEDLKAYTDVDYHVGIVSRDILDDVGAVTAIPVQDPNSNQRIEAREEIFFDLKEDSLSDQSKVIDGQGNTIFDVYFSRKVFKLVFHIGRDGKLKNAGRQKGTNDNWLEWMYADDKVTEVLGHAGKGSKSYTGVAHMTYNGVTYDSTYVTDSSNIKKNYVPRPDIIENDRNLYIIEAKYGAYIGDRWPSPVNPAFTFDERIDVPEDNKTDKTMYIWTAYYDSLYYRNATKRDAPGNTNGNNPDINGIHDYMSGELCADQTGTHIINDKQVHHLVAYFGDTNRTDRYKEYHIMKESVEGVDLPAGTETNPGTDYSVYLPTEWSKKYASTSVILPHSYYELSSESPTPVISNLDPKFQLGPELEGYTQVYSCYDPQTRPSSTNSSIMESHIYFFYTPKQYKLRFMYESGTVEKDYYYGASLKNGLDGCEDPEKEGYYFQGWYTNAAGEGEPFDFDNTTMPADSIVLYPVLKPLQYTVKIDPNGGVIDHRSNSSQTTYFTANYGTTVGEYSIKRGYIRLTDKELDPQDTTYYDGIKYYYINTQFLGESHEGDWGYPTELRSAVYVAENELDTYYNFYCSTIDNADQEYWTGIKKLGKQAFIDKYTSYPYRPIDAGNEHYSFMGWYQVYSDGSVASMPFDFNTPVTGPLTLRALWRLDGGYYIQYNPYFFHDDGEGHITVIVGEMEEWQDPNPSIKLYADQAPTQILRAPTNTTQGWIFRGWRVVKATGTRTYTDGEGRTHEFTVWEPIAAQNIIYYQPGEDFTIDSNLVSQITNLGSIIHMQAFYEPEEDTERRPLVANLILDSNDEYGYGYINSTNSGSLPPLSGPGVSSINTGSELFNGHPTQILIGDMQHDNLQSNMALHLYRYATTKEFNGVAGTNFFQTDEPYMLIGFDENADPEHPTTGSAYVPAFSPDSVIAVTRNESKTLYAMWEPMIYVTLANDTAEPIEVVLDGRGTDLIRIVNTVTGEFDREEASNRITVPAHEKVKIVLPVANTSSDTITATAVNNHYQKRMSVKGELDMGPGQDRVPDGTGCEDIPYGYTTVFTEGTLRLSPYSLIITYTEELDTSVKFDVNGGRWQESSTDYVLTDAGLYSIDDEKIIENNNEYEPAHPSAPDANKVFIGWTTNPDIAAHTDFTGTNSVTWGDTVIDIQDYDSLYEAVMHDFIWDFSDEPPTEHVLYAVYSNIVTVTFDLIKTGNDLHNWTGPNTTDEDGMHVFYRSSPTSRYVTYKLIPGEILPKPSDPAAAVNGWYFLAWLKNNQSYKNTTTITNYNAVMNSAHDFAQGVTESMTLYTSWTATEPKYYIFTVTNNVFGPNDDFDYTVEVKDVKRNKSNKAQDPTVTWGKVTTPLKNGETFTVVVKITFYPAKWNDEGAYSVGIDVINRDGDTIKSSQVLTYTSNDCQDFSTDYRFTLTITQETKEEYDTSATATVTKGIVEYPEDFPAITNNTYSFISREWYTNNDACKAAFLPEINNFVTGEKENRVEIEFFNRTNINVAPTGFNSRHLPFFLMMATGLLIMILLGCMRMRRRRTVEPDEEKMPPANTDIAGTGPPGGENNRNALQKEPAFPDTGQMIRMEKNSKIRKKEKSNYGRKMKGVIHPMKKKGIAILAIMLVIALLGSAAFAESVKSDGTVNTYNGIESSNNKIGIAKQIVFVNAEATAVREPNIIYTYTIVPASVGTSSTVTDYEGNIGIVNTGVADAVTGTVTSTTSTVEFKDTATVSATSNGTASAAKYAEFTFDPTKFKVNDVLTPGIYRYLITETCNVTKASVGITEAATYADKRFLDVYVKWNDARNALEIYGYVLFEGSATDSIVSTDVTMKSAGYVNTATTDGQQADVDVYKTQNLYIYKTTTGALAQKNNDFPITVTLTAPTGVLAPKMDVTVSGDGSLTNTSGYISAWGDVAGTVRDNSTIAIKGIPNNAKVSIVERNNTVDSYKVKAGTTSGAADLLTEKIVAAGANAVATSDVTIDTKSDIYFTNTLDTISPTGYVARFAPYALMLIGGIALLIIAMKHKKHSDEE